MSSFVKSTSLTLNLTSNSGTVEMSYPIPKNVLLSLVNAQITFTNAGQSLAAGSLINIDLDQITSHTSLNGNLDNEQILTLTNDTTKAVTQYNPRLSVGLDQSVPIKIDYKIQKSDGSLVANLTSVLLQFNYIYLEK
jgi:hypothetical protein